MLHHLGRTYWKHALIKLWMEKNKNKNKNTPSLPQACSIQPDAPARTRNPLTETHSLQEWEEQTLHKTHFIPKGADQSHDLAVPSATHVSGHCWTSAQAVPSSSLHDARAVFASWRGKVKPGGRAPRWFSCEQMRGGEMAFICQKIIRNAFIWTSRFHSNGSFCSLNTPQ